MLPLPAAAAAAADRHDLGVEDDDRGHPEGQRDGLGEVRRAVRVVRHAEQAQRAAGAHVLKGGELGVDHRLAGRVRVEQPALEDLRLVGGDAHGVIRARHGGHLVVVRVAGRRQHHLVQRRRWPGAATCGSRASAA